MRAAGVVVRLVPGDCLPKVERPRRPRTRNVLPLRLAQQAVGFSRARRQPPNVLLRVVPTHVDHWVPPAAPNILRLMAAAAAGNTGVPLIKRHLVNANRKRLRDPYQVLRPLTIAGLISSDGDPIMNSPEGTTTSNGQSAQSRNTWPTFWGLSRRPVPRNRGDRRLLLHGMEPAQTRTAERIQEPPQVPPLFSGALAAFFPLQVAAPCREQ